MLKVRPKVRPNFKWVQSEWGYGVGIDVKTYVITDNYRRMVGVERLTTTRLSTTKVINKYQQNQRDQLETKTCSTTTLWQKCDKIVRKIKQI